MKCSIIIRAFNEAKHIGKLLQGIEEQDYPDKEVILVDSGSQDGTVEIARHFDVKVVSIKPEDFSFGYALNIGCEAAEGDILVLASAHVYPVYRDWLSLLVQPFEDNPDIALTYGRQIGNEVTRFSEHRVFQRWFPEQSNFDQQTPFCNNANAAIRKKCWEEQPYDEQLTGLEDLEWAKKMMNKNWKIAYVAEAEIVHVHEEKPRHIMNRYRREAIALKRIMEHQHFNFLDFIKLFSINVLTDYAKAIQEGVFVRNIGDIFVFRLMQFWGTFRGFQFRGHIDTQLKSKFYYPDRDFSKKSRQVTESRNANRQKIEYQQ